MPMDFILGSTKASHAAASSRSKETSACGHTGSSHTVDAGVLCSTLQCATPTSGYFQAMLFAVYVEGYQIGSHANKRWAETGPHRVGVVLVDPQVFVVEDAF